MAYKRECNLRSFRLLELANLVYISCCQFAMQKALLLIACFCMLAVYAEDSPKGRKITFSTITDISNEEVKYNKENPKEGSEEDLQAKRWVSVTSDGYETMGTLKEVMEEMSQETEESKDDPSTPGGATRFFESPHNPINLKDLNEGADTPDENDEVPTIPGENDEVPTIPGENDDNSEDSDNLLTAVEDVLEETKEKRRVFGHDSRIKVSAYYLARYPWRTMGRIDIGCTGTFVRGKTILTAGHCVHRGNNSPSGWYKYLNFRRAKNCNPNNGYYYKWKRAVTYWGWYRHRYQHYDIAIITTYYRYGNWMAFGYRSYFPSSWYININGYPGDKAGRCMWHSNCKYVYHVNYGRQYRYLCDTAGGMSGSAVYVYFRSGSRIIYGVHAYGYSTHNRATRITSSHFNKLQSWIRTYGGS